jgi:hypothetical protein
MRTTLSTIQVFTTISIELAQWLIKALVKIMRAFILCGTDKV